MKLKRIGDGLATHREHRKDDIEVEQKRGKDVPSKAGKERVWQCCWQRTKHDKMQKYSSKQNNMEGTIDESCFTFEIKTEENFHFLNNDKTSHVSIQTSQIA